MPRLVAAGCSHFARSLPPAPNSQRRSFYGHGREWHYLCFVRRVTCGGVCSQYVVFGAVEFSTIKNGLILLEYVLVLSPVRLSGDGLVALGVDAVLSLRLS